MVYGGRGMETVAVGQEHVGHVHRVIDKDDRILEGAVVAITPTGAFVHVLVPGGWRDSVLEHVVGARIVLEPEPEAAR